MGVEIPVGYSQATMKFRCIGRLPPMVVTFGFQSPTGLVQPAVNAQTIYTLSTGSGAFLEPSSVSNSYTNLGVDVTQMTGNGPFVGSYVAASQGTNVAAPPPPNCALLVNKVTSRGGRKGRGRMFWPPMFYPEASVDSAGWYTAASLAGLQTRLTSFLSAMGTANMPLALLHSDLADSPDLITALVPQYQLATQRRRLR